MRRAVSPRSSVAHSFGALKSLLGTMKKPMDSADISGRIQVKDLAGRLEAAEEQLEEIRMHAILSAVEAAPARSPDFDGYVARADPETVTRKVERYLTQEMSLVGLDKPALLEKLIEGLQTDATLPEIIKTSFADMPAELNIPFNHYITEAILRESLGMDGHKTCLEVSPDGAEARAYHMRVKMGASTPGLGPSAGGSLSEDQADRLEALKASFGLNTPGGGSDELFHVAVHFLVQDTVARVEALVEDRMPEHLQTMLHGLIEGTALSMGPQVTLEDESPERGQGATEEAPTPFS